jgi:hypothetical protein
MAIIPMAAQSGSIAKTSVEPSEIALLAFVERAESPREKDLADAGNDEPPRRRSGRAAVRVVLAGLSPG